MSPHPVPLFPVESIVAEPSQGPSPGRALVSGGRRWGLESLAGRFVELSGSGPTATLTAAATLILQAQQNGEPAAWIASRESSFFPPDFAASGIDLDALAVVHVDDSTKAARVADALLRSGGFAIVVLDFRAKMSFAIQSRLAALAKKHHTALLCITRKQERAPSLGSLVSIRGEIAKRRADFDRFACELRVIKDKRGGPGWGQTEIFCGPDGLC